MIKITTLKYDSYKNTKDFEHGSYRTKNFVKYVAENGNFICTVNGEIVTKEEGNKTFRELKSKFYNDCKVEKELLNYNDEEIIKYLKGGIDRYVEYIDNYNQYRKVKDNNERLWKLVSEFMNIC